MEEFEAKHLYEQFFDMVYRICFLYMKQESDACDMAQETFLRLLKKKPQFDNEEKAGAWLIVTASNCCKTQLAGGGGANGIPMMSQSLQIAVPGPGSRCMNCENWYSV